MKDNSGARFRVIAAATSERSRGESRRTDHVGRWAVCRNDDMYKQAPAVRCRRNVIDEQTAEVVLAVAICECEI